MTFKYNVVHGKLTHLIDRGSVFIYLYGAPLWTRRKVQEYHIETRRCPSDACLNNC